MNMMVKYKLRLIVDSFHRGAVNSIDILHSYIFCPSWDHSTPSNPGREKGR